MQSPTRRKSRLVSKGLTATTPRTIRLEPEFWEALDDICARESIHRDELIRLVKKAAPKALRSCAVRVFILQYYRNRERAVAHREGLRLIVMPSSMSSSDDQNSKQ